MDGYNPDGDGHDDDDDADADADDLPRTLNPTLQTLDVSRKVVFFHNI
jgi:hypothetical protein